jgi:hypothetical protein
LILYRQLCYRLQSESGHADGNSDTPKDQPHAQITSDFEDKGYVENASTYTPSESPQSPRSPEPGLPQERQNKTQSPQEPQKTSQSQKSQLDQFGIKDPVHGDSGSIDIDPPPKESQPDPKTQQELNRTQPTTSPPTEETKLPKLPEMPEEIEDHTSVVTEEEFLKLSQESSRSEAKKPDSLNPRISVEEFLNNDISLLDGHSLEQSPAAPIIGYRDGEIPGEIAYFCKTSEAPNLLP